MNLRVNSKLFLWFCTVTFNIAPDKVTSFHKLIRTLDKLDSAEELNFSAKPPGKDLAEMMLRSLSHLHMCHFTPLSSIISTSMLSFSAVYATKEYQFEWLGTASSENDAFEIASSLLTNLNKTLSLDSDVYFIYHLGETRKIFIFEAYSIFPKTNVIFQTIANAEDFSWNIILEKVTRRRNFHGAVLVALISDDLRINIEDRAELARGDFAFIGSICNFSVTTAPGRGWIYLLPNNSIGGMGQQLLNNEGDIILQSSEIISYRLKYLSYVMTDYTDPITAFFEQPPASFYRNIFIQSFDGNTWMCFALTWITIVLSISLLGRLTRNRGRNVIDMKENGDDENDDNMCNNSLLLGIGILAQQGYYSSLRSNPIRIAVICALLIGTLTYLIYSASTFSILKTEKPPVQSIDDLIKHGFSLYTDEGIASKTLFKDRAVGEVSLVKGLELVNNGKVFVTLRNHILIKASEYYNTSFEVTYCTKSQVNIDYGLRLHSGPYIRKDSQYKETFRTIYMAKAERGVTNRDYQKYVTEKAIFCTPQRQQNDHNALGIRDIMSACFLLGGGFLCSFFIYLLEMLLNRRHKSTV